MERRSPESGFTILELVIAFGLLATVILGVMTATMSSAKADRDTVDITRGQDVARQVMEQVLAIPYVQLLGFLNQPQSILVGKFRADCRVTQIQQGLVSIDVAVSEDATGGSVVRLSTLRAQR